MARTKRDPDPIAARPSRRVDEGGKNKACPAITGSSHQNTTSGTTTQSKSTTKMPAATTNQPLYNKDDKVLCFHGEFLYEAKILDMKLSDAADKKSPYLYLVHYKGWKNTWDDWVSNDRIRKPTEENRELARTLRRDYDAATKKPSKSAPTGTKRRGADDDDERDSEARQDSLGATGRKGRGREDLDKEEAWLSRPEIRIPTSDTIKAILVDDWEHITKNLTLVTLPSKHPANVILRDYFEQERLNRREGSAEADILEESIFGLEEYFKDCLGRILLYTFEREQYNEVRHLWEGKDGKGPGDIYGGEHLLRLIVKLPELIAQTNMDIQAIQHLREEMIKLTSWLTKNVGLYFEAAYEPATKAYIDKARAG